MTSIVTCCTDSAYLMMPSSYGDHRLVSRVRSVAESGYPYRDTEIQLIILDLKWTITSGSYTI